MASIIDDNNILITNSIHTLASLQRKTMDDRKGGT